MLITRTFLLLLATAAFVTVFITDSARVGRLLHSATTLQYAQEQRTPLPSQSLVYSQRHNDVFELIFADFVFLPTQLGQVLELTSDQPEVMRNGFRISLSTILLSLSHRMMNLTRLNVIISDNDETLESGGCFDTIVMMLTVPRLFHPDYTQIMLKSLNRYSRFGSNIIFYSACADNQSADDVIECRHIDALKSNGVLTILYEQDQSIITRLRTGDVAEIPLSLPSHSFRVFSGKSKVGSRQNHCATPVPSLTDVCSESGVIINDALSFHLTWASGRFWPWQMHLLDSIFHGYPNATVNIYSNVITSKTLAAFTSAGCDIRILPFNLTATFECTPLFEWFAFRGGSQIGVTFLSDAMRLALVYKYGGTYMDFDILLLKPLDVTARSGTVSTIKSKSLTNMLARELPRGKVNGAFLSFDRGHPFLRMAMHFLHRRFSPFDYLSAGPKLLRYCVFVYELLNPQLVYHRQTPPSTEDNDERDPRSMMIYEPDAFFSNRWFQANDDRYWRNDSFDESHLRKTLSEQYIFHLWAHAIGNRLSRETHYIDLTSMVGRLFLATCYVFCDQLRIANS